MMRLQASALVAAAAVAAAAGCGGSGTQSGAGYVRYHEPSQGWTASLPAGWASVAAGPDFVRSNPLADPTRLTLRTYRRSTPSEALRELSASEGVTATGRDGVRAGESLRWQRFRGRAPGRPTLAVELAVARDGTSTHAAALVAPRSELGRLVETALLPALDSFSPGRPDTAGSLLATVVPDPSSWPTGGWKVASPSAEGMDAGTLEAMVREIRAAKLPVDSVTVVRHGAVVLDTSFGGFADGRLGEPYALGRLHELQSATKSVTSMLLGIALAANPGSGATVHSRLLQLAAAVGYVPAATDARKRAITIEDLLTMQAGLRWHESGYAYRAGSGNDVMAMIASKDWTRYAIDRPMATAPGTTFVYNTGASQLASAAVTLLSGQTEAQLAAKRLFGPLGIRHRAWLSAPEGSSTGGFGLELAPDDLAKLAFLYLHSGRWDGRQIVPAAWARTSTTDHVADTRYEYGYLWWLDRADGYAFMAGLYGQLAVVDPADDLVAVITAHIPGSVDASTVTRWLLERYILPAAR